MTHSDPDSPDELPDRIRAVLEDSSDSRLRQIIHDAQRRLREHPPVTDAIEAREGEEIVRTEDHGAYTLVVVERPDETGEGRGPFAYRVTWESDVEAEEDGYRWHYVGKADSDTGG